MKVYVDIDEQYEDTKITIQTNEWSPALQRLMDFIQQEKPQRLFGIDGEQTVLLDPRKIDYFYAEDRKVFAKMEATVHEVRMKLFELEEAFHEVGFMRLSKSVVGNLERISRFELSFNGNLCVYFQSGNKEYISRKYVASVKKRLEMGGKNNDI